MRQFFARWFFRATHNQLPQLSKVARMIKNHLDNVVTYIKHGITNAVAEGLNRKIRLYTGFCGSVGDRQCSDEGFAHTPRGARGAPLKGVWTKVANSSAKGSAFCCRCA